MENSGWSRYISVIVLLSAFVAIISINPLGIVSTSISLPKSELPLFERGSKLETLAKRYREGCPRHQFTSIKRLSRVPDMMLIEGFLTKDEADILVELAYPAKPFAANEAPPCLPNPKF